MENKKDNRIICGDCLEVFKTIADKSIDLVCTDPPYEFISKDPVGDVIRKKILWEREVEELFEKTTDEFIEFLVKEQEKINKIMFFKELNI